MKRPDNSGPVAVAGRGAFLIAIGVAVAIGVAIAVAVVVTDPVLPKGGAGTNRWARSP